MTSKGTTAQPDSEVKILEIAKPEEEVRYQNNQYIYRSRLK